MDDDVPRLLCGTPELPPHCVALTFDDGPGPRSAELARLLRDEGVPGTFFVLGESVERHGDVLDTYRDCGHVIGLHGDQHRPFSSAEHAAGELSRCAERIRGYLGDTAWFRPPYGMGDWPVPGFAGPVGWHAQGRDWDITYRHGQTVDACVDAIAQQLIGRDGGIVLLHDFAAATEFAPAGLTEADLDLRIIEITTLLIERLRGAGLSFAGLPEPAQARAPEPPARIPGEPAAGRAAGRDGGRGAAAGAARGGRSPSVPEAAPRDGQGSGRHPRSGHADTGRRRPSPVLRASRGGPELVLPGPGPARRCQVPAVWPAGPWPATTRAAAGQPWRRWRGTTPTRSGWRSRQGPTICSAGHWAGTSPSRSPRNSSAAVRRVGLLVILDANLADRDAVALSNEPWMVYNLVLAQFGYVPALTPAEPDPEARMLELVRRRPGLGLDEWPDQRVRALQRVIKNNVAVAHAHQPGRVHCPLLFFSATRNPPALAEKLEIWRTFVDGPIEAVELDCDHRYMLLPEPIAQIGPALTGALARAASGAPGSSPLCNQAGASSLTA